MPASQHLYHHEYRCGINQRPVNITSLISEPDLTIGRELVTVSDDFLVTRTAIHDGSHEYNTQSGGSTYETNVDT